jgi:hypothetical protein
MKDSQKIWVWVGVVVVVIILVVWGIWKLQPKPQVTGPVPAFAPQGQLVPNFPKGLILDNGAIINGSYSINYSSSTNQYTAEYDSSSTVTALYNNYQSYLPQNGWTITGSLATHPTFDAIAATQNNNQLQVVISTKNKGSQVTITYVVE